MMDQARVVRLRALLIGNRQKEVPRVHTLSEDRGVRLHRWRNHVICNSVDYIIRMIKANTQWENGIMALVRVLRGGQVTLPAEARKALGLSEGDYLDLEVAEGTVTLKPITVIDRAEADRELDAILSRVKYIGPEPPPSEDEMMDMVADEVREVRAGHAKGRSR